MCSQECNHQVTKTAKQIKKPFYIMQTTETHTNGGVALHHNLAVTHTNTHVGSISSGDLSQNVPLTASENVKLAATLSKQKSTDQLLLRGSLTKDGVDTSSSATDGDRQTRKKSTIEAANAKRSDKQLLH